MLTGKVVSWRRTWH